MAKYVDIERFPTLPEDPYNKLSEYARGYLDAQENLFNLPVENVSLTESEIYELNKVFRKINYYYQRALKLDYVYNKLGWAVYEAWKEVTHA